MSARLDTLGRRTHWAAAPERFRARVTKVAGCWQWDVTHPATGYGTIYDSDAQKNVLAHRWSYEHFVGPIPDGLQIDHLCRNRGCVNPEHLEPVTQAENAHRGFWAIKTHCAKGHEYTPENTYRGPGRRRRCRRCTLRSNAAGRRRREV